MPMGPLRRLSVDNYLCLLKQAQMMHQFFSYCYSCMRDKRANEVRQLVHHNLHAEPRYEVTPHELRQSRLWTLLDGCSKLLSNAKEVQSRLVSTYNEDVRVPASVVICPLYSHDEVSKKGSLLVLMNALESASFLHKAGERHYRLGAFASNCHLVLFGDMLTDDMMACVKEHVISCLTDIGREEYVYVLNSAMERSTHLNGMLHVKMHNLVVIYWFFYGAFLQAFQAELLCFK